MVFTVINPTSTLISVSGYTSLKLQQKYYLWYVTCISHFVIVYFYFNNIFFRLCMLFTRTLLQYIDLMVLKQTIHYDYNLIEIYIHVCSLKASKISVNSSGSNSSNFPEISRSSIQMVERLSLQTCVKF